MKLRPVFAISALTLIGIAAPVVIATPDTAMAPTPTTIQLTSARPVLVEAPPVVARPISPLAALNGPEWAWPGQEAYENGELSARDYVNGLPYSYRFALPVLEAYEVVAKDLGWDDQKIHDWRRFVHAIIRKESSYCWNLRRGVTLKNKGRGCAIARQGTHSDAGFGQLTRTYFYAPGRPLCDERGLCDAETIVSEPYLSMASVLWTIDYTGRSPWCYTDAQEESTYFGCRFAPGNKYYDPTDDMINFIKDGRDVS